MDEFIQQLNTLPFIYMGTRLEDYWNILFYKAKFFDPFAFWELCDFIAFTSSEDFNDLLIDYLVDNGYYSLIDEFGLGVPCGNKIRCFVSDTIEPPTKKRKFVAQSEVSNEQSEVPTNPQEQNTKFMDDQVGDVYDITASRQDSTYHMSDEMGSNSLGNFLERTVPICTINWQINTNTDRVCYPWEEFLSDPAITRKIDNYFMFRADGLRLHFKINGSPFHYGRAYAAFTPTQDETFSPKDVGPHNTNVSIENGSGANGMTLPKCLYTQQPGVFIDPTTNQPEEMIIPFFFPLDYIDLRYAEQLRRLGTLRVFDIVNLQHANGGTEPVNIQVFASLINPVLTMPTYQTAFVGESYTWEAQAKSNKSRNNNNTGMKPKNSKKNSNSKNTNTKPKDKSGNDEYGNGIISAPASALANFAGYLESVPVIGPYATATKVGSSAVSKIASLFGFSRPTHIEPTYSYRPRPYGLMANTEGDDTIPKLSLDPKQELSIDPATVGLEGTDQMSLAHVFRRESLIAIGEWTSQEDPGELVMAWKVSPMNFPTAIGSGELVLAPSALGWASMPFMHWRGSIEYRIMVVASQMHRGRLVVQWQPTVANDYPTNISTWEGYFSTTEIYSEIVDLTEGRDYTFCVNYAQPNPWLETGDWDYLDDAMVYHKGDNNNMSASNFWKCNGIVTVRVVTELGAPADDENVKICVFARGGKDYTVRNPTDANVDRFSYEEPYVQDMWDGQSNEWLAHSADYTSNEENAPCQENVVVLNGELPGQDMNDISSVYFGEQIVSIRNLIKRYSYLFSRGLSSNATNVQQWRLRSNMLPPRPGVSIGNLNYPTDVVSTTPYSFVQWSFIRYFLHGFAGYRGSCRWKVIPISRDPGSSGSTNFVRRDNHFRITVPDTSANGGGMFMFDKEINDLSPSNINSYLNGATNSAPDYACMSGGEINYAPVNGGIEFEVPFQSNLRFVYSNESSQTYNNRDDRDNGNSYAFSDWQRHNWEFRTRSWQAGGAETAMFSVDTYVGAGEDFSLFFFTCAPFMYQRVPPS